MVSTPLPWMRKLECESELLVQEFSKSSPDWQMVGNIVQMGRWSWLPGRLGQAAALQRVAERVKQILTELEQHGVKLFNAANPDSAYQEKARQYKEMYAKHLDAAHEVAEHILAVRPRPGSALDRARHELQSREASLRYRLGQQNGGLDRRAAPDADYLARLTTLAQEWKFHRPHGKTRELNVEEKRQLAELAKYPEWLDAILQQPDHLKKVFDWALLNDNPVAPLVCCPETVEKLKKALLSSNLGYVRRLDLPAEQGEVLAFGEVPTKKIEGVAKRVLRLPLYHGSFEQFNPDEREWVNILKGKTLIHFKQGDYTLPVQKFFEELGQKNQREAKFTLAGHWGFVNFHPVEGVWHDKEGRYHLPDMRAEDWLNHVPPSKVISHRELQAQYGDKIEGRNFFFKVMAGRTQPDLKALDCHAFWQLYVRMDDANWKVVNVGTYAYRFAQSIFDGLWLFGATVKRVLCLADQNGYYTQRQRGALPFFPGEEASRRLLRDIHGLIGADGIFQFAGRNCAQSVQTITAQHIPNFPNCFLMPLVDAPSGLAPLDRVLAWSSRQWEWVRRLVVGFLYLFFLSWRRGRVRTRERGEEIDSLNEYIRQYGHNIFNPAHLCHKIAQGKVDRTGPFADGELYGSHADEKRYQLPFESDTQVDRV